MASPGPPDELHPEREAQAHNSQPQPSSSPDLSSVPGNELRKLTDSVIIAAESNGGLYAPIFRQLQIRADKQQDFHSGVIRVIRNRHHKLIQRASDASLKSLTDFLLRAFGYIIWKADSDWVLDKTDLDEGEAKLIYVKGRHNVPDCRFHPILEPLWRQMRNLMFTRRRQGPTHRSRASGVAATDGEDSYLADVDTRSSSPVAAAHARARARATAKLDNLAAHIARNGPAQSNHRMSTERTEDAIIDLIARLAEIRANSDPRTFEELWQVHIMRAEELDDGQGMNEGELEMEENTVSLTQEHPVVARAPDQHCGNRASQSNVPFMTEGTPVLPRPMVSQALIPPSLPSVMSVYVSVSRLPTQGHFDSISHTTAASLAQAYHWPSAPVREHNVAAFFTGICYRVDIAPSAVLGRFGDRAVQDTSRLVARSPLAVEDSGSDDRVDFSNQCQQPSGARACDSSDCEMMDTTSDLPEPATSSPKPALADCSSPGSPVLGHDLDDFTEEEWRVIALGWRDFQNDLRHAARMGMRIWRMKVCVVVAAASS
ncbi:uncharacterized protein PV07_08542 [Cladophialophora immunda]|uniref:Uncharacterized protein n=1 Tax=Cladophialophora immunda TaxID=569365 RepID=A0A0D2AK84_9EURO|nr:uncharacterized protein PV07_08542 [Cladophialophora immunda]KIW25357.1 hypothetical protein PV07_08542 [Cladophialophora immunda]